MSSVILGGPVASQELRVAKNYVLHRLVWETDPKPKIRRPGVEKNTTIGQARTRTAYLDVHLYNGQPRVRSSFRNSFAFAGS